MSRRLVGGGCIGAAVVAAVVPFDPLMIEHVYSRGAYPILQRSLTPLTNLVPMAVLDLYMVAALVLAAGWIWLKARPALKSRRPGRVAGCGFDVIVVAAVLYLAFLAMWGFNYRRVPLQVQLDFDLSRVSPDSTAALARRAVEELNDLHARIDGKDWPESRDLQVLLGPAFEAAQRALGSSRPALPGRPKWTLLSPYLRLSAVDGMTNPLALEVLVSDELLPFERPFLVAHEWAHLAGYADESEASFVAWLICQHGDEQATYSAWLYLYPLLARGLPAERRDTVEAALAAGPRRHLRDIATRLSRASPVVQRAASRVYDGYLRANRVEAGIASYDQVVLLLLGTRFEAAWVPVRLERLSDPF